MPQLTQTVVFPPTTSPDSRAVWGPAFEAERWRRHFLTRHQLGTCSVSCGPVYSVLAPLLGLIRSYRPSYNVSPGAYLPVVFVERATGEAEESPAIRCMKWGLVPSFTKKTEKPDHYKMVMKIMVAHFFYILDKLANLAEIKGLNISLGDSA
ncbi:hypothetical protein B296_00019688 [Ensete ventricosum]|uniref:Uncharacterized protein n=1 Tax=Ensete ventricosum TaxID=4639 RepID=A0A426ZUZ7_ENSVE|nr:hypothetical protein B296_00019688 [Ensete ventricosum]